MVISCAKCSKSFLLPDDKIKPTGTRVRCKQCGHEFVVMPPALEEPVLVPEPDPRAITPASGLQRSEPPAAGAGDVASSYEITFQGLDSGTPAAPLSSHSRDDGWKDDGVQALPMEEPPPTGGMSDADLVSALQSDPLTAAPEEAPPSGGDVSIDFGVLDEVPEPPPPVAPSGGASPLSSDSRDDEWKSQGAPASPGDFEEPPPPQGSPGGAPGSFEMDGLSLAEPEASAPGQDAASFQLDNLSLEEPPPEEHAPSMMAEPMPGGGGGGQSASAGADPLAGLDLDFTLDEKAMGGGPSDATQSPSPAAPAPSIFEPTSVESAPPPPPTAVTQESLKAEFESLGRDSLIKGNLDEIQAPEAPAFQAPPPPKEPEPVRPVQTSTTMAAKAAARAAEKEKKVVHLRRQELRSPIWLTAPLWLVLLACFGTAAWWFSPGPAGGTSATSAPSTIGSMAASWIGLRPVTEDVSPSIRQVRGRSYQNAYGEKFYIVTGVAPKVRAETQSLRATFLDAQGWKMGQETAYWVTPPPGTAAEGGSKNSATSWPVPGGGVTTDILAREFALLGLRELRQALTNLAVGFSEAGTDVSFVMVYPTPLKTPDHYLLEWSDASAAAPSGGS